MHCTRKLADDLYWIGGNDKSFQYFEGVHPIPEGISYNSYLMLDEKTVLFDTCDWKIGQQLLENLDYVLNGRTLDYVVVDHMEPDHAATLGEVLLRHPDAIVVGTAKAHQFMEQYGFRVTHSLVVKEGDKLNFGRHTVAFYTAPMVHWPEVMVAFDETDGILFSADAFGSFRALDGAIFNDEVNYERDWEEANRRYYTNIVGKFGKQVMAVLKKASKLDIRMICPLHGVVWRSDIDWLLDKYTKWATYTPEGKGILIAYGSMYGHTENAAHILAGKLYERGLTDITLRDTTETHVSYLISDAFRCSAVVLLSVTYNMNIFPPMQNFLDDMKRLNLQNRKIWLAQNGTWAPNSGKLMSEMVGCMNGMEIMNEEPLTMKSSVTEENEEELNRIADQIAAALAE